MQADRHWEFPGHTPDSVMAALPATLTRLGWKDVTARDGTTSARKGSALAFRLFGAFTNQNQFPMKMAATATPAPTGTTITVSFISNEGRYIHRVPAFYRMFDQAADTAFKDLREALGR